MNYSELGKHFIPDQFRTHLHYLLY